MPCIILSACSYSCFEKCHSVSSAYTSPTLTAASMSGVASSLQRVTFKAVAQKQAHASHDSAPVAYRNHALRVCLVHRPDVDKLSHLLDSLLQLGTPPASE
jgi:hypothetical protein